MYKGREKKIERDKKTKGGRRRKQKGEKEKRKKEGKK